VRDKCARRIGLETDRFKELLKDKKKLINFLVKIFPGEEEIINDELKLNKL